jgi:hypothetical protein
VAEQPVAEAQVLGIEVARALDGFEIDLAHAVLVLREAHPGWMRRGANGDAADHATAM